jgi:non-heme chloroperoxidase
MSAIKTKDGAEIYYKDWGEGPVVTFSHGWPLNADAWDGQMLFLAQKGYRCIAHDRRGHGRSSQASSNNDMNGYADDLAAVIEALNLKNATLVGHSTGGGEVARYIARHGSRRVAKAVLVAAVPPIMLKSESNPEGLPMEVFDKIRAGVAGDRSQFYKELAIAFYGANRPGAKVSQGTLDQFWLWSMQAGAKGAYESVKAFSETDFTEDLMRQAKCGRDVEVHHRLQPVRVATVHWPGDGNARVVHQHANGRVLAQPLLDPQQIRTRCKVRG